MSSVLFRFIACALLALAAGAVCATATELNAQGESLREAGRYEEARAAHLEALTIRQALLAPDHLDIAQSLNNLALLYFAIGDMSAALPALQRAKNIYEKHYGADHEVMATVFNNLAVFKQVAGKLDEAQRLHEQALRVRLQRLGEDHVDTAESQANLADVLVSLGRHAEAIPLLVRALEIREKAYGADHVVTANSLNNLAFAYYLQARYADALPLFQRAAAIHEQTLGLRHETTGTTLGNLARLYKALGRHADALPLFRRSVEIYESALGPEHVTTAAGLSNLASAYETLGRFDAALPLHRRALAIAEKAYGAEHASTAAALNNLALLHVAMAQYGAALPLYQRALHIYEKSFGGDHETVARTLSNLAELYRIMGRYADASGYLKKALAITEKRLGQNHPDTAALLNNFGKLHFVLGQYAQARTLYARALSITGQLLGEQHGDNAPLLMNLAQVFQKLDDHDQALAHAQQALQILENIHGERHDAVGSALLVIAESLRALNRLEQSQQHAERALRILRNALGSFHTSIAWAHVELGQTLDRRDDARQATAHLLEAIRLITASDAQRARLYVLGAVRRHYAVLLEPALAIFYGKQAVNVIQQLRRDAKTLEQEQQASLLESNSKIYQEVADLLISEGRLAEAQQVLAMLKEDEYFDFIHRAADADPRTTRASFSGQEAPWDARLQKVGAGMTALGVEAQALRKQKEQGVINADEQKRLDAIETSLQAAGEEFAQVLNELQAAFTQETDKTRFAELEKKGLDNDLSDTIGSFGSDVALLQYIVMDDAIHLILTTGATRLARKAILKKTDLNRLVADLQVALQGPAKDPRPAAQALYRHLIGPVAADLAAMGARMLMLSLDGVLRYVPMAALHDGGKYLAERYALALYTDAARERIKDKPQAKWRIGGLGLTQAREGFSALPAVKAELASLVSSPEAQGVLPGLVRLDEQFTPQSLKATLRERYPVLHIASHFQFDPAGEGASFLLTGGEGAESRLSLASIRTGGYLFSGVDLLTLSACQTAVGGGKDANGREIEGFGVLAQKQGAKGVIATLWPVADASTGLFMQNFYRLREEKKLTKAEALRQAQLVLLNGNAKVGAGETAPEASGERGIDRPKLKTAAAMPQNPNAPYAHPYYWAPFILMGNWL